MHEKRKLKIPLDRTGDREALKLLANNYARAEHQLELLKVARAKLTASKEDFSARELATVEFWIDVVEMIQQATEAQDLSALFCSDIIEKYEKRFAKLEKSWHGLVGQFVTGSIYVAVFILYKLFFES